MDRTAITALFGAASLLAVLAFRAHRRFAGTEGRPGPLSMAAFVVGWLASLAALLTGLFLVSLLLGG